MARFVIGRASFGFMALAIGSYWLSISFRIVRWRMLLSSVSVVSIAQVGQALIVGYAVNNVFADTEVVLGASA